MIARNMSCGPVISPTKSRYRRIPLTHRNFSQILETMIFETVNSKKLAPSSGAYTYMNFLPFKFRCSETGVVVI